MKKVVLLIMLPFLLLSLSACTIRLPFGNNATSSGPNLGGVFLSTDGGVKFVQQTTIPSASGKVETINPNVRTLVLDPSDNTAIYMGTYDDGLYYAYNILNGWIEVKSFPKVTVNNIAINPKNKCDIYVTFANRLYRSLDCTRTWSQIYLDGDQTALFSALTIDPNNPLNIYLGTSLGDILKSIDGGTHWRVLKRINTRVSKITFDPKDSRRIYVITNTAKLFTFRSNTNTNPDRSANVQTNFAVTDWTDLSGPLKDLQVGDNFRGFVLVPSDGSMFMATDHVIARSDDKGVTWRKLNLLPSQKDAIIRTIAVNPLNSKNIYYASNITLFRSVDGGTTWSNKKLPTSRGASSILIDYKNAENVYLGVNELGNVSN